MGRKKYHRSGASLVRSVERIGKGVALIAPHAINMTSGLTGKDKLEHEVWLLSGYAPWSQRWEWQGLVNGWGPYVATEVGSKLVHKLIGIVRGI